MPNLINISYLVGSRFLLDARGFVWPLELAITDSDPGNCGWLVMDSLRCNHYARLDFAVVMRLSKKTVCGLRPRVLCGIPFYKVLEFTESRREVFSLSCIAVGGFIWLNRLLFNRCQEALVNLLVIGSRLHDFVVVISRYWFRKSLTFANRHWFSLAGVVAT